MDTITTEKQGLINWIKKLNDPAMLKNLKSLKNSTENTGDWWDEISEAAKESIQRGEEDIKAGRVYTSKEFWVNIQKWREKQNL